MVGKFSFLFIAAKTLTAEDISLFGGISSLILVGSYLVTSDLYIGATRCYLSGNKEYKIHLSNQFIYSLITCITLLILIFVMKLVDSAKIFLILSLLIIIETVLQEIYRWLIACGDYKSANLLFFIKAGSWCYASTLLIYIGVIESLSDVFYIWGVGLCLGLMYAIGKIKNYFDIHSAVLTPSFSLFRKSFYSNAIVFLSSISFLLIGNADKLFLGLYAEGEISASYILFSSITGSVMTIIFSGVINPYYAKIVISFENNKIFPIIFKIFISSILVCIFSFALIYLTVDWLLYFINKVYFTENKVVLYWLMLSVCFSVLSLGPHYYLFAQKSDKLIAACSLLTLLTLLLLMFSLYENYSVFGVIYSVVISSFVAFASKLSCSIYVNLRD